MAKRKLGGLGKGLDSLFEDLPMTEDASPDLTRLLCGRSSRTPTSRARTLTKTP